MKLTGIISIFIVTAILGCGTSKEISGSEEIKPPKAILVDDLSEYQRTSAYVDIQEVVILDNQMTLNISYSGGCKEHEFELIGTKSIMKTLPPKRGIMLYHNSNDDSCRELIEEILTFDITDLGYPGGEIILNLEGYDEPLPYTMK